MRRFKVHLVTEIDFVRRRSVRRGGAELPEASLGHPSERGARDLASDDQGRPGRERLGHRNQG